MEKREVSDWAFNDKIKTFPPELQKKLEKASEKAESEIENIYEKHFI